MKSKSATPKNPGLIKDSVSLFSIGRLQVFLFFGLALSPGDMLWFEKSGEKGAERKETKLLALTTVNYQDSGVCSLQLTIFMLSLGIGFKKKDKPSRPVDYEKQFSGEERVKLKAEGYHLEKHPNVPEIAHKKGKHGSFIICFSDNGALVARYDDGSSAKSTSGVPNKQELLWLPKGVQRPDTFAAKVPLVAYPFDAEPKKLWTLPRETDQKKPPRLPYAPVHNQNAFLEDKLHDWKIVKKGMGIQTETSLGDEIVSFLDYFSRVSDGGCWVLLEF